MFKATSNLDLSYTLSAGSPFELVGTGAKKALEFKKGAQGVKKGDFNANGELEVTITASQAGNGSYHAAQSVTRTFKIKKPSKSVFYDERKVFKILIKRAYVPTWLPQIPVNRLDLR